MQTRHLFLCALLLTTSALAETTMTVKLVKANASRCSAPAQIVLQNDSAQWHRIEKPYFSGENDREIYFDIASPQAEPEMSQVTIVAPGVKIQRAIVGRTDVAFKQAGDRVMLRLVDDRAQGQMMQTDYQSPRGGLPISFRHEWKMRRNGDYLTDPYPEKQIDAIPNYLVAAQEALRRMGYGVTGAQKSFAGDLVLMGSENATTRGHTDFPPHFHIMHYEYELRGNTKEGLVDDLPVVKKWHSRLAPHFYMDDQGRVILNKFAAIVGKQPSGSFGIGQTCTLRDSAGHFVLDLTVQQDGALVLGDGKTTYILRPGPAGVTDSVDGYHDNKLVFRVHVHDDAEHGHLRYEIENMEDRKSTESFRDGFDYDPFTAKITQNSIHE